MRKKYLLRTYSLTADEVIIKAAKEDIPEQKKMYRGMMETYQNAVHMNCQIKEGVLMVGIYFTRDLRIGAVNPAFVIMIDREKEVYWTWDTVGGRFRSASLVHLPWPEYAPWYRCTMSEANRQIVRDYLKVSGDAEKEIWNFQQSILEKRLKERYRKETAAWDAELAAVPPLPRDWDIWADRHGLHQHYLFYEYSRKKSKEGYCTWCRKTVPINENPRHNQIGICGCCGHRVQFKSKGKAGRISTTAETAYLMQLCGNGIVLRQFKLKRWHYPGKYESPYYHFIEERRVLYDQNGNEDEYYYGTYKNGGTRWIKGFKKHCWLWNSEEYTRDYHGEVYRRTLSSLEKTFLGRTGLLHVSRNSLRIQPDIYLQKWKRYPYLEQLSKAGLYGLASSIVDGRYCLDTVPAKGLAKTLKIDRGGIRRLKQMQGTGVCLDWLRYEKEKGTYIPDKILLWFQKEEITIKDLLFILDRMTPERIYNYLKKQSGITSRPIKELISTWADYLNMAKALKQDVALEIFYKPKDLTASHNKMIEKLGGRNTAVQIGRMMEMFPEVDAICSSIKEKYAFEDKEYRIVVPDGIRDIIVEGTQLDLCVSWSDFYFDRIEKRESYLMFLRRTEQPDTPFYMLEVEPGGTIRQKRTYGDEQTPEIEEAYIFLRKWQAFIQKNMTKEDECLARTSAECRMEEFKELRKRQAKIWHGNLWGKLLADVLEADLLEAALCAKEREYPEQHCLAVSAKAV